MTDFSAYNQLLGVVCSVFEAYSAVLILPSGQQPDKHWIAAQFSLGNNVNLGAEISAGQSLAGWVLRDQQPLLVNNVEQAQNSLGYYLNDEDMNIKAFMAAPLPGGKGVLCVDSKRQYSFSDKDQKILHLFCEFLGGIQEQLTFAAVSRTVFSYYSALQQLYNLRKRFNRWSIFLQHFLRLLSETTGFSYCFFAVRDEKGENYILEGENAQVLLVKNKPMEFPMGSGLVGWTFRDGSPLFAGVSEAALSVPILKKGVGPQNIQAVACLPVSVNLITRGVVCLTHDKPLTISDDMKGFLTMAAEHLTLFLDNLYTKNKLQQATRALKAHEEVRSKATANYNLSRFKESD